MLSLISQPLVKLLDLNSQTVDGINTGLLSSLNMSVILLKSLLTLTLSSPLDGPRAVEILKEIVQNPDNGGNHALISLDWSSFDHFLDKHEDGVEMGSWALLSGWGEL